MTAPMTPVTGDALRSLNSRVDGLEDRVEAVEDRIEALTEADPAATPSEPPAGLARDADAAVAWLVEYKAETWRG